FFFSSRRRHTRCLSDWSSDVCSSDLLVAGAGPGAHRAERGPPVARGRLPRAHRGVGGGHMTAALTIARRVKWEQLMYWRNPPARSEERRVGKGAEPRWAPAPGEYV